MNGCFDVETSFKRLLYIFIIKAKLVRMLYDHNPSLTKVDAGREGVKLVTERQTKFNSFYILEEARASLFNFEVRQIINHANPATV